jgi:hypothetical protein
MTTPGRVTIYRYRLSPFKFAHALVRWQPAPRGIWPNPFVCSATSGVSGILSNSEQTGLGRIADTSLATPVCSCRGFVFLTDRREELKRRKRGLRVMKRDEHCRTLDHHGEF